ncbi:hypothetical protein [Alloyangia pacifica]|uniref:hypothetical protein n=1 Tax=Alloyangia pacifica TaxID=311180 RepID=UPI001CFE03AF|nr:hypothetical protein [Alloyangia pacifica]
MNEETESETVAALLERIQDVLSSANHERRSEALSALEKLRTGAAFMDDPAPIDARDAFPTEARPPRSNAMFLPRPDFLQERDSWDLDPDTPDGGWRKPRPRDGALMAALRKTIQNEITARTKGLCPDEVINTALLEHLAEEGLGDLEVYLGEPEFLPGVTLAHVVISDLPSGEDGRSVVLEALFNIRDEGGTLTAISFDYTSPPLHEINTSVPVRIAGNEVAYLRYFLKVVNGSAGAFRVVDKRLFSLVQECIRTQATEPDSDAAKMLELGWHDLRFAGFNPKGGILIEAFILYQGSVFKSLFCVLRDGNVSMLFDNQLVKDVEGMSER